MGRIEKAATWFAFGLLGFSVVVNVSGFIAGLRLSLRPGSACRPRRGCCFSVCLRRAWFISV